MERNLMIAGFGGQGILMLGRMLSNAVCEYTDKNVSFFPTYGAEQRGGTANCYVVISDDEIGAPLGDFMDELIVMNEPSLSKFLHKLVPGGTLFVNRSVVHSAIAREDIKVIPVPATETALELGDIRVLNIIMLGFYIGYTALLDEAAVLNSILQMLEHKQSLIPLNRDAYFKGLELGKAARCQK